MKVVKVMPASKAQQKAVSKYMKENYDVYQIRMPKGRKEIIQNAAIAVGQSVNAYINQAIDGRMERDNGGGVSPEAARTPPEDAQTLTEAKRIVRGAGDVILPSLLRESVAEASRAAGETDDAFLWRAVSAQAEQDSEKRKAAVNASDAPQEVVVPLVVSLSLDELERAKTAAAAAGESVTKFIKRAVMETAKGKAVRKPTKRKNGGGATPIPLGAETPSKAAQKAGQGA